MAICARVSAPVPLNLSNANPLSLTEASNSKHAGASERCRHSVYIFELSKDRSHCAETSLAQLNKGSGACDTAVDIAERLFGIEISRYCATSRACPLAPGQTQWLMLEPWHPSAGRVKCR